MKPDIDIKLDGRLILKGSAYQKMKIALRNLASSRCEKCRAFTPKGDVDHINGRGGGKRDDRIFVNGKRNLQYLCRGCHSGKHVPKKVIPAKVTDSELMELLGVERKQE